MKKVITIGREFGSGGREIGRRIAEKLQIAYYDQEIVTEISKRTRLSEEYVERITEDRPYMSYPIHVGTSFYMAIMPIRRLTEAFRCLLSSIALFWNWRTDPIVLSSGDVPIIF